jgi:hypothetical protein
MMAARVATKVDPDVEWVLMQPLVQMEENLAQQKKTTDVNDDFAALEKWIMSLIEEHSEE